MASNDEDLTAARAYVSQVMTATGRDPTNLARLVNMNPSTLTRLMSSNPRGGVRRSTLEQIARITGIPLPAALTNDLPSAAPAAAGNARSLLMDVPVHALIGSREPGFYFWNQTALDYVHRPPGVARVTRLFALRMPDDSMAGWRMPGDLVYVDPTRPVAENDHAFIEVANTAMPDEPSLYVIRRVVRRRASGVVLQNWGFDPKEITVSRDTVLAYHRVMEWAELLQC